MAVAAWQRDEAQLCDAKAAAIEAALAALDGLAGMFDGRMELRAAVAACKDLLQVEEANLRLRAERLATVER